MNKLKRFRRDVVSIMRRECFTLSADIDQTAFDKVFAHDTAHAIEHGIDAETVARRLIEEIQI